MSFQIGDIIQKSLPTDWKIYGTVLAIKRSFGYPDELTIKWQGEIQPDGNKLHYPPDFEDMPESGTIFDGADLDYLQEQEFFLSHLIKYGESPERFAAFFEKCQ